MAGALLLSAGSAGAAITVKNYFPMGDVGDTATSTFIRSSIGNRSLVPGTQPMPVLSADVSAQAAARTGSQFSRDFSVYGSYVDTSVFAADTDNFGVEAWVKPAAGSGTQTLICNGTPGTDGWGIVQVGNTLQGRMGTTLFGSTAVTPGTWVHVAMVRSGGTATLYVNEAASGTSTATPLPATGVFALGGSPPKPYVDYFRGSLDQVRYFTFEPGQFSMDDLLTRTPVIAVEQPVGSPLVSATTQNLGTISAGGSKSLTFTIRNTGLTPLSGISADITGLDASQFTASIPVTTLAAGGTTQLTVECTPATGGRKSAILTLASNSAISGSFQVMLKAAVASPEIAINGDVEFISGLVQTSVYTEPPSPRPPAGFSGIVDISGGDNHLLALKGDGTVTAWSNSPQVQSAVPKGLKEVMAIAAGGSHSMVAKKDGTLLAWGAEDGGAGVVPAGLSGVVAISTSTASSVALTSGGVPVSWGSVGAAPTGVNGLISVSAGRNHCVGLKADGTVVCWGQNSNGQATVPSGLTGVVAVSAGDYHTLALKSDRTVVAWGSTSAWSPLPSKQDYDGISAGSGYSAAIQKGGNAQIWGSSSIFFSLSSPTGFPGVSYSDIALRKLSTRSLTAGISDRKLEFGTQVTQTVGLPKVLTIRNQGDLPLHISSVTVTGVDAAEFSLSTATLASTVAAGGQTTISVKLAAGTVAFKSAMLKVVSDDPQRGTFYIPLTGYSIPVQPDIAVFDGADPATSPELVDNTGIYGFPETASDGAVTRTFTIQNKGAGDLTGLVPTLSGENITDFSVSRPAVSLLSTGQTTTFTVTFSPTHSGISHAAVKIASNDPDENPFEISLSGLCSAPRIAIATRDNPALTTGTLAYMNTSYMTSTLPAGISGVQDVKAGISHAVALLSGGKVVAWGGNDKDQLHVPAGLTGVLATAVGDNFTLALTGDGHVLAWGANDVGQCNVPVGLDQVVAISAGINYAVALKSNGTVVGWGSNKTYLTGETYVPLDLFGVVGISTSGYTTVALKNDGQVVAWGYNYYGGASVPADLGNVVAVACSTSISAALLGDGHVRTWGGGVPAAFDFFNQKMVGLTCSSINVLARRSDGMFLQLGDSDSSSSKNPNPAVRRVAATCAQPLIVLDSVVDFGRQSGPAAQTFTVRSTGSQVLKISSVAVVEGDVAAFSVSGTGSLPATLPANGGMATFSVVFTPGGTGPKKALLKVVSDDPATGSFYVSLTGQGIVPETQIAIDQPNGTELIPGQAVIWPSSGSAPAGLSRIKQVALSSGAALAQKDDGTFISWGENYYGQASPPEGLSGVVSVVFSNYQTAALKNDGTLVSWGQPGVSWSGISGVAAITGGYNLITLKKDGTVKVWTSYYDPDYYFKIAPEGLAGVVQVVVKDPIYTDSYYEFSALKNDGTVVSWGRLDPAERMPAGLSGVKQLAAGSFHTVALKTDGTVMAWGRNNYGQTDVPFGLSDVEKIGASGNDSYAIKSDGSVVHWGNPSYADPTPAGLTGVREIFGTNGAVVAVVDPVVSFSPIAVGASGAPQIFRVRNPGTLPLHVTGFTFTGGNSSDFVVDAANLPAVIAPGGQSAFTVTFTPGATGRRYTTLRVLSDDLREPEFLIPLLGTGGVQPTALETWRLGWFGPAAGTGDAADLADPNHNGIPNLMEYALGGDPVGNTTGRSILPRGGSAASGLYMFFSHAAARPGVILTVQASDSVLGPWTDFARSVDGGKLVIVDSAYSVSSFLHSQSWENNVYDRYPSSDPFHPRRFMRLSVSSH